MFIYCLFVVCAKLKKEKLKEEIEEIKRRKKKNVGCCHKHFVTDPQSVLERIQQGSA